MSRSFCEPCLIGFKSLFQMAQRERGSCDRHVLQTVSLRLDASLPTVTLNHDFVAVFINRKNYALYFRAGTRHVRNTLLITAINRHVTAKTKRWNHNVKAPPLQLRS